MGTNFLFGNLRDLKEYAFKRCGKADLQDDSNRERREERGRSADGGAGKNPTGPIPVTELA